MSSAATFADVFSTPPPFMHVDNKKEVLLYMQTERETKWIDRPLCLPEIQDNHLVFRYNSSFTTLTSKPRTCSSDVLSTSHLRTMHFQEKRVNQRSFRSQFFFEKGGGENTLEDSYRIGMV